MIIMSIVIFMTVMMTEVMTIVMTIVIMFITVTMAVEIMIHICCVMCIVAIFVTLMVKIFSSMMIPRKRMYINVRMSITTWCMEWGIFSCRGKKVPSSPSLVTRILKPLK